MNNPDRIPVGDIIFTPIQNKKRPAPTPEDFLGWFKASGEMERLFSKTLVKLSRPESSGSKWIRGYAAAEAFQKDLASLLYDFASSHNGTLLSASAIAEAAARSVSDFSGFWKNHSLAIRSSRTGRTLTLAVTAKET